MKLNALFLANIFNCSSDRISNNTQTEFKNTVFDKTLSNDSKTDQWKQTAKECGMNEKQFQKAISYMLDNFPNYVPSGIRQDKESQAFTFVLRHSYYTDQTIKIWYKNGKLVYDMAKLREKAFECKMNDKDFMSAMEYIKTNYEGYEIKKIKQNYDKKTQTNEVIFVIKDNKGKKVELPFVCGKLKDSNNINKPAATTEIKQPVQAEEKTQGKSTAKPTQQTQTTQNTTNSQPAANSTTTTTQKTNKTDEPPKMIKRNQIPVSELKRMDEYVANSITKFKGGGIPISEVHNMSTAAKYTGISESYIRDVLVGIEVHNSWPETECYDDLIPGKKKKFDQELEEELKQKHPEDYKKYVAKNEEINKKRIADGKKAEPLWVTIRRELNYCIGTLTIGFGHTSLAGEPKLEVGMQITEKQAYQILANDILNAKKLAKNKLDRYKSEVDGKPLFSGAPKSIQDAIVDLVYNKGPDAIDVSLIENLKKGYLHSAARRTWYDTPNIGLQKRNIYRFISAVRDLSTILKNGQKISDAENAVKNFFNEHSAQMRQVFRKDINAKGAWNLMCGNKKVLKYKF